jgi:hypothetical protein
MTTTALTTYLTSVGADNTAAKASLGTASGTGVAISERGPLGSPLRTTVITLTAFQQAITDALAYGSTKIYTFPEGVIQVVGTVASVQFTVVTANTTINDSGSLTWSLGTVAASNITLSSTMVNILPKTTKALPATNATQGTASNAFLAAPTNLDGSATPLPVYINFGFETNTDIDADGTLQVDGTITITWIWLGDY